MKHPERAIALALGLSTAAGLALAITYVAGGQSQLEGVFLAVSLGGIGAALIVWGKQLLPLEEITEERERGPSPLGEREAMQRALEVGDEEISRRRLLSRLLLAAAGALGIAALFPIRSLGPKPGRTLFETPWRAGSLVVSEDGSPVNREDLVVGSVVTVFPQRSAGSADGQAVLIRVEPELLELPPERQEWAPEGYVAYSKVCTHAGCPVGLYLAQVHELRCPCHQSAFDVLRGAEPISGPAARPLPQLPLSFDDDGNLIAGGDFAAPVGPGFWNLP